jgi:hypothetical protein
LLNPLNLKEFFSKKAVCGKGAQPSQTAFFAFGFAISTALSSCHDLSRSHAALQRRGLVPRSES